MGEAFVFTVAFVGHRPLNASLEGGNVDRPAFLDDLTREDDVGLVVRGHIHIESLLIEILNRSMSNPERVDWDEVSFKVKLMICAGLGLPLKRVSLIGKLNSLRNDFAHRPDAQLTKQVACNLYNALDADTQALLKGSYLAMFKSAFPGPASIDPRDLIAMMFLLAQTACLAFVESVGRAAV